MLNIEPKDRIAIYFFYDGQGIVDSYVLSFLEGLREVAGRILVVVNGSLTHEAEAAVASHSDELLYRPNMGMDAWAYKEAFEHIGWEKLRQYKEVIYCNATVFGPVYPFTEMFDRMAENEDLDFWGITFHPILETQDTLNPYGYIPEHIQHYFMVYRQRFTKATALKSYWDKLPAIQNYEETVGLHETVFTKHFSELGFKWDTYIRYTPEEESTNYILMHEPLKAVLKYHSPVIKRKTFFLDQKLKLLNSYGERVPALLKYLHNSGLYDTDMIYENIIRTSNQADFVDSLSLNYVFSEEMRKTAKSESDYTGKTAVLFIHNDGGRTEEEQELSERIPERSGVFHSCSFEADQKQFLKKMREAAEHNEYILLINEEIPPEAHYCTSKRSTHESDIRSLAATRESVRNVLDTFDENRFLGMIVPLPPMTLEYGKYWFDRWEGTFDSVSELVREMKLTMPISSEKHPIIPYMTNCWIRSKAVLPMLQNAENIHLLAGTSEAVFRRLLAFGIQQAGYASGLGTTDALSGLYFSAISYYTETFAKSGKKKRLASNNEAEISEKKHE